MRKLPLIGALLACLAAPAAYAQYDRPMECWNPGAGHFEQVRPGEYQNDLDYGRCRAITGYYRGDRPVYREEGFFRESDRRYYCAGRETPRECWNPRARMFEAVRPGERQDDLDFARCRALGAAPSGPAYYGRREVVQECWNPRAGHFENVREGTFQNDLDYSRCRTR